MLSSALELITTSIKSRISFIHIMSLNRHQLGSLNVTGAYRHVFVLLSLFCCYDGYSDPNNLDEGLLALAFDRGFSTLL